MSTTRNTTVVAAAVGTSLGASDEITYGNHAGGVVVLPVTTANTSLQFYVDDGSGTGRFVHIPDADLTVVQNKAYEIPISVFGGNKFKLVTNTATMNVQLLLKS